MNTSSSMLTVKAGGTGDDKNDEQSMVDRYNC